MVSSPMLAPRLMPEMIMSGNSSRSPVTARWTQSVGVPLTNRKPFPDLRTESGRSRVRELEAPLRSRSGATTMTSARGTSVSARIALQCARRIGVQLRRLSRRVMLDQGAGEVVDVACGEIEALRAGGRHDVGGVAGEKDPERRDALLDGRA